MPPRANWKGYLKLSLVTCPVALSPATSDKEKVSFHLLNSATGHRLKQQYVDTETGAIVDREDRVKGYEVGIRWLQAAGHREETDGHIERLETIFDQCGVAPRAIRCDAMDGILAESKDVMVEIEDGQVHDAGMLAAARTVEHYEIARYGTLIAWANLLGIKEVSKLLGETLDEEKKTDQLLTQLAEANINQKAA